VDLECGKSGLIFHGIEVRDPRERVSERDRQRQTETETERQRERRREMLRPKTTKPISSELPMMKQGENKSLVFDVQKIKFSNV
jgi:hypothetical protein